MPCSQDVFQSSQLVCTLCSSYHLRRCQFVCCTFPASALLLPKALLPPCPTTMMVPSISFLPPPYTDVLPAPLPPSQHYFSLDLSTSTNPIPFSSPSLVPKLSFTLGFTSFNHPTIHLYFSHFTNTFFFSTLVVRCFFLQGGIRQIILTIFSASITHSQADAHPPREQHRT